MNYTEFHVGRRFRCGDRVWMCTDKGTRVITAICLTCSGVNDYLRGLPDNVQDRAWEEHGDKPGMPEVDPSWVEGPPYALNESVFDEYDQKGCEPFDGKE